MPLNILKAIFPRDMFSLFYWIVHTVAEYVKKSNGNSHNTFPYNVTGHPALTINAGYSIDEPNLPIGMMLVGRHFDDVTVLRLAHAFERLRDSSPDYQNTAAKLASSFQRLTLWRCFWHYGGVTAGFLCRPQELTSEICYFVLWLIRLLLFVS